CVSIKPVAFDTKEFVRKRGTAIWMGIPGLPPDDDGEQPRLSPTGRYHLNTDYFARVLNDPHLTITTFCAALNEAFTIYLRVVPPSAPGFRISLATLHDITTLDSEMRAAFQRQSCPVELEPNSFERLLQRHISFELPAAARLQHQWVVAPTGSGKTQ